jgi:hypothetical protein
LKKDDKIKARRNNFPLQKSVQKITMTSESTPIPHENSNKTWSHKIYAGKLYDGTFIIRFDGARYFLSFREPVGDAINNIHDSKELDELWSHLLDMKNMPSKNGAYPLDVSSLDILIDLEKWTSH